MLYYTFAKQYVDAGQVDSIVASCIAGNEDKVVVDTTKVQHCGRVFISVDNDSSIIKGKMLPGTNRTTDWRRLTPNSSCKGGSAVCFMDCIMKKKRDKQNG